MTIAKTILDQIGGNQFIAMTGTGNFVDTGNGLRMKIKRNKSGAGYLKILLMSNDLYKMTFYKVNKDFDIIVKKEYEDIYNDMLASIFEKVTGFYTSL